MGLIRPLTVKPQGIEAPRTAEARELPVTARNDEQYSTPYECPFPLYLACCTEAAMWKSIDYKPGRVLVCTHGGGAPPEDQLFRADLDSLTCTQDVILAPLYEGGMNHDGPWPLAPVPAYDHNLEVLREVAPQVRGVLVGNRCAEMGYCQSIHSGAQTEREMATHRICTAVEEAGNVIRSVGGRPAFGLIDYQILLDCYWSPGQPLRRVLQDLDAIVISFLGFKFWPKMKVLYDHDREERILPKKLLDGPPYPMLTEWLSGVEAWGGVDYIDGLMRQHPSRMFAGGFDAGVIGQLPDGTI